MGGHGCGQGDVDAFIVMFEDVLFLFNSEKDTHSHVTESGYKISPRLRELTPAPNSLQLP